MVFSFHIASVTLGEHAYRTRTRERAGSTRLQSSEAGCTRGRSRPSLLGRLFEVVHQVGHILVVRVRCGRLRRATLVRFRQLLEVGKVVGAQLIDDARKQILQLCGARADSERG